MIGDKREIELKFAVDAQRGEAVLVGFGAAATVPRSLESRYFDTSDHALREAGFTLRVRKDGVRWTQTVKSHLAADGLGRGEWENPVSGGRPEANLIQATPAGAFLDGAVLAPLFEVRVERRSLMVREACFTMEASLDAGEVSHLGRSSDFRELELEFKQGDAGAFFAAARQLRSAFTLRPSFTTKAGRGFDLISGGKRGPRHFQTPRILPGTSAGAAFRTIALAALEQIAGNAEAIGGKADAEVIHQMRIGARRLRSALSAFDPIVEDDGASRIVLELKWLAGELDRARNLDVLLTGPLRGGAAAAEQEDEWGAAKRALQVARRAAHAQARDAAGSDRLSTLLLDAFIWIEMGWRSGSDAAARDRPIETFAAAALETAYREVRARARHFTRLGREDRHKLRIRAKALRYDADTFGALFAAHPKRVRCFTTRLKILLDRLGELTDIATGEALLSGKAFRRLRDRQAARERRLIGAAREALDRFEDAKRFWPKRS